MLNKKDKAERQRYDSICNFIFMHGSNDHQPECKRRHMLVTYDLLDEETNQIENGQLRFNVLKIISPIEFIVQPTEKLKDKWHIVNNSDTFAELNAKMQKHYKVQANQIALHPLELGQKCVVLIHEIFYRAEIVRIIEKR